MRLHLLGTAGWMPTELRETTCIALRDGHTLFLFDAGTGLRRLADPCNASLVEGIRDVHLFLTHYHLDHTCGLAYLSGVLPLRVTVHAPDASITGIEPQVALAGLLRRPYNPRDLADIGLLTVEPIGREAWVAGHRLRTRPQQHSDTSVAYRIDDALVIATDTSADTSASDFAAGAAVLLHECWYSKADLVDADAGTAAAYAAHSEAEAVGRFASRSGAGRLVLIHLNPLLNEDAYRAMADAARRHFAATAVLPDGAVIEINAQGAQPPLAEPAPSE